MVSMTETKEIILTSEGMQNLKNELEYLKTEKRKEVSEKITELEKLSEKRALYNGLKRKIGELKGFLEQLKKLSKNPSKKDNHEK